MAGILDKFKKEAQIKKNKPKAKAVTFYLYDKQIEAFEIIARATDKSRSQVLMELMDKTKMTDDKELEFFRKIIREKESNDINNNEDNNEIENKDIEDKGFNM